MCLGVSPQRLCNSTLKIPLETTTYKYGGADATGIQPTLSTIEQSRAILRVVVDAMASAMNAGQSVQGGLSPCAAPIDR